MQIGHAKGPADSAPVRRPGTAALQREKMDRYRISSPTQIIIHEYEYLSLHSSKVKWHPQKEKKTGKGKRQFPCDTVGALVRDGVGFRTEWARFPVRSRNRHGRPRRVAIGVLAVLAATARVSQSRRMSQCADDAEVKLLTATFRTPDSQLITSLYLRLLTNDENVM